MYVLSNLGMRRPESDQRELVRCSSDVAGLQNLCTRCGRVTGESEGALWRMASRANEVQIRDTNVRGNVATGASAHDRQ